jgi:hypothetical protein
MKETDIKSLEERFEPAVVTAKVAETITISC